MSRVSSIDCVYLMYVLLFYFVFSTYLMPRVSLSNMFVADLMSEVTFVDACLA